MFKIKDVLVFPSLFIMELSHSFDKEGFVATIYGAAGSTSIIVKVLNTLLLTRLTYNLRFGSNIIILLLGIAGIAFAPNFVTVVIGVVIVGAGKALGENLALGYISRFDGRLVYAWSCGSGCAGLVGALFVIAVGCAIRLGSVTGDHLMDLKWYGFVGCSPIVLLYGVAYFVIIDESSGDTDSPPTLTNGYTVSAADSFVNRIDGGGGVETADDDGDRGYSTNNDEQSRLLGTSEGSSVKFSEVLKFRWAKRWYSFKLIWKLGGNLAMATFATYVCRVAAAKTEDNTIYDQDCPELYASLQLCFMAAQFASMSSGQMFRIRNVQVLTVIQLCNAAVWGLDTVFKFMPVYILPAYMVIVGLIMGAIYVNTFSMVHNDEVYQNEDKDLLANMTSTFLTVGVSVCSILMTALYKTVLVDY